VHSDSNSPVPRRSDIELVRMAQQGNADAFEALYNAHKVKVYSLCLRMTSNVAEAEDLAQVAFLQVFRKLSTFRGDSALSTWLYRIVVNTVLMHFRKKGLRELPLDEPIGHAADAPRREIGRRDRRLSGAVDRIALTRAIEQLPSGYRATFVLHEVEGYGHHEIAQQLRCSVGTSKSQLHKAKAKMRELLKLPAGDKSLSRARSKTTNTTEAGSESGGPSLPRALRSEAWASEAA
jgi:RNA polymerase sigma-70 factor (ECF subfamily)